MSKRKFCEVSNEDQKKFLEDIEGDSHKHTLDSDEEDVEDEGNVLDENDIEGEEDGISRIDDTEVKITPFNMREELEEGHFDADGHYQFKKEAQIKDNWLDNIDWIKVKKDSNYKTKDNKLDTALSSSDDENDSNETKKFDLLTAYKEIHSFMNPNESINRTLQRLNKSKSKISTAQRWKMKKQNIVDTASENITKITGLANEILTQTGNMDAYEETYEEISNKIKVLEDRAESCSSKKLIKAPELDMYADDFDEKETGKLIKPQESKFDDMSNESDMLEWEYKVSQDDDAEIHGPYNTEEMQQRVNRGDFKEKSVFVRKVVKNRTEDGDNRFYTSNRIDFELYL